jgi:[Skp1-protein]-hydroxyproline N-acetylglucosaminyltransferase
MKRNSIFVSIASYRDDVCYSTVKSLFETAYQPQNVFVGICQQNHEDDSDCIENIEKKYRNNIRIIRISHRDAKGPTYARYLCSTLCNDEEFYFQIDSHTKFVKNWDIKCIEMINEIKSLGLSQKPVLSHYPRELKEFENYDEEKDSSHLPRICKPFFNTRDMISFMGSELIDSNGLYHLTPFTAGGMVFCESYFLKELPYDPNLPYVFVGEEILHSIRFYTHGWDIFTPKENIVFHEYTRTDKPKIWTDNPYYSDMDGFNKIKYMIGLAKDKSLVKEEMWNDLESYGLGKVRTLQQYYELTKIDLEQRRISSNFCRDGNLASEDDIERSNEKNWKTNEEDPVDNENNSYSLTFILSFSLIFLFLIVMVVLLIIFIGKKK